MSKQDEIPEAAGSVTYSLIDPNGYPLLYTVRETSGTEMLDAMSKISDRLKDEGYKPQEKGYPRKTKKPVEYADYPCPNCKSKVKKGETKDGKPFEACTNKSWNNQTRKYEGCDYFKMI